MNLKIKSIHILDIIEMENENQKYAWEVDKPKPEAKAEVTVKKYNIDPNKVHKTPSYVRECQRRYFLSKKQEDPEGFAAKNRERLRKSKEKKKAQLEETKEK